MSADARLEPGSSSRHVPILNELTSPRNVANTERYVSWLVRGLVGEGIPSKVRDIRTASETTWTEWMFRSMCGSAHISTWVLSGPMPARASAAATFRLAGKAFAASRADPTEQACGLSDGRQIEVVLNDKRRAR